MNQHQTAKRSRSDADSRGAILLVEDDPMVRRVTQLTLEKAGYRLIQAENGEEARDAFEASREEIELLVTDVVMPRLSGVELAKALLSVDPELKILFVSGYSSELDGLDELAGGRTRLLHKPYSADTLLRAIEGFGLEALLGNAGR